MQELLQKLKINEKFTKPIRGIKFDKVRANTYPKSDYNFMADLLHLPQTKLSVDASIFGVYLFSSLIFFSSTNISHKSGRNS